MNREQTLQCRIKLLTWLFIIGLVVSGATAIPLMSELDWLVNLTGARQLVETPASMNAPDWAVWLAFGHFVIALVFIGALRDPVRNRWLFDFGLIACVLVIPFALVFGGLRGIPFWWRLIDCSFGVFGFIPLWFCRQWTGELETLPGDKS